MELKKIGILSLGKIAGLFGVIYGLISGLLLSFIYAKSDLLTSLGQEMPPIVTTLGYTSIIVMPILNGAIYFVAGIVLAFVYNILAKKIGGVELNFSEEKKKK